MKPSQFHTNRHSHNWLIYDVSDKWLDSFSKHYSGTIVDLGCGEAAHKEYFLQYAQKYVGVDWGNTLHNTKADVLSNLNEKINLPEEYADTIVSLSVLEHLCEPQIFLQESYRILKNGGTIVLGVPWMWQVHEAPHDYFRYTPYGLRYLFEKAGYVEVFVQPTSGFFTMWILKMNYFTLRFIRGSRLRRTLTKAILLPCWYIAQKLAPWLDSLHRGWSLESAGYYVIAKKEKKSV